MPQKKKEKKEENCNIMRLGSNVGAHSFKLMRQKTALTQASQSGPGITAATVSSTPQRLYVMQLKNASTPCIYYTAPLFFLEGAPKGALYTLHGTAALETRSGEDLTVHPGPSEELPKCSCKLRLLLWRKCWYGQATLRPSSFEHSHVRELAAST